MVEEVKLIAKGAEADLYEAPFSQIFFDSMTFDRVIMKLRIPKSYRVHELDVQLRRQRTLSEAKIIHDSRSGGANVPIILGVWLEKCLIVMEKIEGTRLKEFLAMKGEGRVEACRRAGAQIGLLHRAGIVHGDPTTSNMILTNGSVYLIDFGLAEYSESLEKKAIDLHLLKTAMKSAHFRTFKEYYAAALRGYGEETGKECAEVFERCAEIEKRGRYVER